MNNENGGDDKRDLTLIIDQKENKGKFKVVNCSQDEFLKMDHDEGIVYSVNPNVQESNKVYFLGNTPIDMATDDNDQIIYNRNLIIANKIFKSTYINQEGFLQSGGALNYFSTDFIPVNQNKITVTQTLELDNNSRLGEYDLDKEFVKRTIKKSEGSITYYLNEKTKFIRWSPDSDDGLYKVGNKLEIGETATPYTVAPEDIMSSVAKYDLSKYDSEDSKWQ